MCRAGFDHKAIKLDDAKWRALPLNGVQDFGTGEYGELRTCSCGSTLCRMVTRLEAATSLIREAA